ncbi:alpha/beta hydrolase [Asticcacaulis sp. DXS10W]|uniref:Alpha/beta hydrolase n=1 Tax=Asticcacaulis currens TaxID=2984210 RepID=A0ABT5IDK1_9CAUL|nr:alpha/beta hydrolase [Asticcacaulis currens]MDC7694264.1 alpha/beta hydrolase [Asticcacaulis currens]
MRKIVQAVWVAVALAAVGAPATAMAKASKEGIVAISSGVTIAYQDMGPKTGRPIILVAGTGMQMVEWPQALLKGLTAQGRRVIIFDNRDAGRSTSYPQAGLPDFGALFMAKASGSKLPLPYTGEDMAQDVTALMTALKIKKADILGMSGGATLAELAAVKSPDRVSSLVLVMSNSGNPALPVPADPKRMATAQVPGGDALANRIALGKALAGKDANYDALETEAFAKAALARNNDPLGGIRQGAALLALGDLRGEIVRIKAPTYVIHGVDDPLVPLAAGEEVAKTVPGAKWQAVEGMGHNLTAGGVRAVLRAISEVAPVTR